MAKAQDAFRTISEVSDALDTPTHVLRFWESKFSQIKPVKRAGGRRYYRPDDMALLAGIKDLLHEQGMTIKGAQKLLREKGVKSVVALGHARLSDDPASANAAEIIDITPKLKPEPEPAPSPTREIVEAGAAEDEATPAAGPEPEDAPESVSLFSAPSATIPPAPAPELPKVQIIRPGMENAGASPQDILEEAAKPTEEPIAASTDHAPDIEVEIPTEPVAAPEIAPEAEPERIAMPPVAKPAPSFPPITEPKDMPARFFASLQKADLDVVQSKSSQIAPLVARLEAARDQLRRI